MGKVKLRFNLRKTLHKIVLLRPLLKILGIKDGTVIAKGAEVAAVVDKALED